MAATSTVQAEESSSRSKLLRVAASLILLAVGAWYGNYWWHTGRYLEATDNAYLRAEFSALTPRVAGEIVALHVHDNEAVAKDALLLEIDPRDYAAKVDSARAAVAQAEAQLASNGQTQTMQKSMVAQAQAQLSAAQALEQQARREWQRAQALVRDGVATHQRLDNAEGAYQNAVAEVARGAAGVEAARRQLAVMVDGDRSRLEAAVTAAKAQLALAEIDLASTQIKAPIAGSVGDLAARLGERVQPGQRLLSLVPLDQVYVEANFKETQLTRMRVGQPVEFTVDAFPGRTLRGHVESFSPASGSEFALLPAQNATGNFTKIVQRVPVRVAIDADDAWRGTLRPGMSVQVRVDTRGNVR
jgi:membrane fusion protein (multidrug efflux system)